MANATGIVVHALKGIRPLFYVVPFSESTFQTISEVPDYLHKVLPYFFLLMFLEVGVLWLQRRPLPAIHDGIGSMTAGLLMSMWKLLFARALEVGSYAWVHERWCVADLPWDSPWMWWAAFFGVDLGYYLFHRMAHEVNIFWAAHQVHHSSEHYNLTTALRQSVLQRFTSWFFYLPLALVVPPPAYLVHKQLNLLYQFWIHTEVVDRLGPLELVLNTPSHHRVHHGRNPYCIDKNYAGVLIIWDRMFGTFQPERPEEKVIYGLVHPLASWNPLWAQLCHLAHMWACFWKLPGLTNKLSLIVKGPGWSPGKPRLGCPEDLPQVSPDEKPYDKPVPAWLNVYCVFHFMLVLVQATVMGEAAKRQGLPFLVVVALILFFTLSLTNFGLMFEHRRVCAPVEVCRLLVMLAADLLARSPLTGTPRGIYLGAVLFSVLIWATVLVKQQQQQQQQLGLKSKKL